MEFEIWRRRRCLHPSYPDTDDSISVVKTWCLLSITEHKINEGEGTLFAKISDNFNFWLNSTIKTTLTVNFRGESLLIDFVPVLFTTEKDFLSLRKETAKNFHFALTGLKQKLKKKSVAQINLMILCCLWKTLGM